MRVVVETPHLLIRTWQELDLQGYVDLIGDEYEQLSGFSSEKPACRAETELWRYQLELDKRGWSKWAVVFKENCQLVGYCGFSPYHSDVEISWRFLQDYRGHGLVIEAIEAVAELGFQAFGFELIISFASSSNRFALDIMEQVGMKLDRHEGWSNYTVARYSLSRRSL